MDFKQGGMSVTTYEGKLYTLSRYVAQLVTIEGERIHLLVD